MRYKGYLRTQREDVICFVNDKRFARTLRLNLALRDIDRVSLVIAECIVRYVSESTTLTERVA